MHMHTYAQYIHVHAYRVRGGYESNAKLANTIISKLIRFLAF